MYLIHIELIRAVALVQLFFLSNRKLEKQAFMVNHRKKHLYVSII